MKPSTSALDVAGCLLLLAESERGQSLSLTNLHLQKLLFYVQGWHLAMKGTPLFEDKLEAWVHGPVVRNVWQLFEKYGHKAISPDDAPTHALSVADAAHVRAVWDAYKRYTAPALRELSHEEPAWIHARAGFSADTPSNRPIDLAEMKRSFAGKVPAARARLAARRVQLAARQAELAARRAELQAHRAELAALAANSGVPHSDPPRPGIDA